MKHRSACGADARTAWAEDLPAQVVVNPPAKPHSRDWPAFFDKLGENVEVDKAWMLCVEEPEARSNANAVETAWQLFRDREVRTLYCSPRDAEIAIGEALPDHDVTEDFGEYVKSLSPPGRTYTAEVSRNALRTLFRVATAEDRRLLESLSACSTAIVGDRLRSLGDRRGSTPSAVATLA